MSNDFLSEDEVRNLVDWYIVKEKFCPSTQEILDSGAVSRLKGYTVRPGKVSDSIFGGKGFFIDKNSGEKVDFENPLLDTRNGAPLRIMVRTERISTHDINRGDIPFKDQILALNHNFMRKLVAPYIGTSQYDVSRLNDNSVVIVAENLDLIPVENVLRAYVAKSTTSTSLYQSYFVRGEREFCGHQLTDDLIVNGSLPYVMDTPSTKSEKHDESVSPQWLIEHRLVSERDYQQIRNASLVAFGVVSQFLNERGLILVDTKTEHGLTIDGKIVSQDELYTMDSSRFWLKDDYNEQMEKLKKGEISELNPKSYSKQFARDFSEGEKGYTNEQRIEIAVRYIIGIQRLIGKKFKPDMRPREERIISGLQRVVEELVV